MSLVWGYLNQTAKYYVTGEFYNGPAKDTVPLGSLPLDDPFKVKVVRSYSAGNRQAIVAGTYNENPVSQTLTFSGLYGELEKTTTQLYDELTSVTTNMGSDPELSLRVVACNAGGDEIGAWVEFPCRWEDKTSNYLKIKEGEAAREIALSDAKVICEAPLKDGDLIRLVKDGVDWPTYEVVKVKPVVDLGGQESHRELLLGGIE